MNTPSEPNELGYPGETKKTGNSFVEFLTITVKYRWFLFWFVFLITLGALLFALLSDKWYKSTVSVLPAEKSDFLGAFSGLTSLAKNFSPSRGLAALTGNTELDRYIAILSSRTMADDVIQKFNLIKVYELEDVEYEKVLKAFNSNLEIQTQDEGNLTVSVFDKDPQQASDIANYMVLKLNEINTNLSVTNAKANREFIEKRYMQNVEDIARLEADMKTFQEKNGVIAVPEQLESNINSMSEIFSQQAMKEIAVNVLKRSYGEESPTTQRAEIELQEINLKINSLIGSGMIVDGSKLIIPFKQAPKLVNSYLKIYRDLEIQYKILEFVQPMYEQAKVEEVRNSPSVLILDKAYPPERKSKPKGSLYALVAFVASTLVGYFIIFTLVLFQKIKKSDPGNYSYITSSLGNDLAKFKLRKKKQLPDN
ncbi:MAG: Wzz/FepE/Etk N-terminal domain-containing protein [Ignavibacteriaceae bacterium]|jgi:uncharacterized protein involved in exopolysaccharide biosynthesis|nr:Wzz/FepE/Etk N-terminal domain-containing protein [Ignavibacterium sp.]MCU0406778.1 Wzz/FepE/Etk N-terminal domain-containing protein [Ignavibacteriaceae bacterium]